MPEKNPRLFVKSFFASSVEAAMEQAHAELGPEALLLDSREAPPEARQQGPYEVVFGCRPAASAPPAAGERPSDAVEELRKRMEEIRDMVARIAPSRSGQLGGSVSDTLLSAGVDAVLAVEIEAAVHHRLRPVAGGHAFIRGPEAVLSRPLAEPLQLHHRRHQRNTVPGLHGARQPRRDLPEPAQGRPALMDRRTFLGVSARAPVCAHFRAAFRWRPRRHIELPYNLRQQG